MTLCDQLQQTQVTGTDWEPVLKTEPAIRRAIMSYGAHTARVQSKS